MKINNLEINNNKENSLNENIENEINQNSFLNSMLGKTINTALDIGIRALLPTFIEDQVIELKDNLLNYGLKEGINKSIESAINLGKSAIGIFTGKFDNISQIQKAVEKGGLIDGISSALDFALNQANKSGIINYNITNTIKKGKNIILDNIENNIEKSFSNQIKYLENIEECISSWKENYNNKNFEGMEKQYEKLEEELKNIVPLENTLKEARKVENLHILIKNNNKSFDLTEEQLQLLEKLE